MGKRREGREAAVQFLVYCDLKQIAEAATLSPYKPRPERTELEIIAAAEAEEAHFWELRPEPTSQKVRDFALRLAKGTLAIQPQLDERLKNYTQNYELHRIATVDRNILRLALYEMFHCTDVPPIVAINEAIEIAKRFGTEESGRFVNGVLDRAKVDLNRSLRTTGKKKDL